MSTNGNDEKVPLIKVDELRKIKGYENLSEKELENIAYSMHLWGVLTFDIFKKYQ